MSCLISALQVLAGQWEKHMGNMCSKEHYKNPQTGPGQNPYCISILISKLGQKKDIQIGVHLYKVLFHPQIKNNECVLYDNL